MKHLNTKEFAKLAGIKELTMLSYHSRKGNGFIKPDSVDDNGNLLWSLTLCEKWIKTRDENIKRKGCGENRPKHVDNSSAVFNDFMSKQKRVLR